MQQIRQHKTTRLCEYYGERDDVFGGRKEQQCDNVATRKQDGWNLCEKHYERSKIIERRAIQNLERKIKK